MCEHVRPRYSLIQWPTTDNVRSYALTSGLDDIGTIPGIHPAWDIYPIPDNERPDNEKEDNLGGQYSNRPYMAEYQGRIWRIGYGDDSPPVKIYFNNFNSDGLPEPDNQILVPEMDISLPFRAQTQLFGLSYEVRQFVCILSICMDDPEGRDPVCNLITEGSDQTLDNLALKYLCFRDNPHPICLDLCQKNAENGQQCDSMLRNVCSDDYAADNPELCACHRPATYYRTYIEQLRQKISELPDKYGAIKSILGIIDYDPSNPHCFHPECMTASYYGYNARPCSDIALCFQGIDLVAGTVDTELDILNSCLLERIDEDITIQPDPDPEPTPDPQPVPQPVPQPSNGKKDSTYIYVGIGIAGLVGIILVIVIIASSKKKK